MMKGDGEMLLNGKTSPIAKGDVVPVLLREVHSFRNHGAQDLELLIIGVAAQKWVLDTEEVE